MQCVSGGGGVVSSYRSMRILAVSMSSMMCHVALW